MSDSSNGYHISFFKPTTPQARANRNLTLWLVLIWFVAIFGFHFLMRAIEKPTPEPAYLAFEQSWTSIQDGTATQTDIQEFGKATLSVLGKISIATDDKAVLNNAFSWSVYELTADSLQASLVSKIKNFETLKEEIETIDDEAYVSTKTVLSAGLSPILNLSVMDVRSKLLPLELTSENIEGLTSETVSRLPGVMSKYLIHNQSVLTDTVFLGFPFHYFYSAVFLLVLFVFLCWLYCKKTDQLNAKFNIVD